MCAAHVRGAVGRGRAGRASGRFPRTPTRRPCGLVGTQIYDLETKYLETANPMGNAIRGYEGFLGGNKKQPPTLQEERLFSWSSITGQLHSGAPR